MVVIMGAPSTIIASDLDWVGKVMDVAMTVSETEAPGAITGALYTADVVVTALRVPCVGGVQVTPAPDVSFRTFAEIGSAVPEPTMRVPDGLRTTSLKF